MVPLPLLFRPGIVSAGLAVLISVFLCTNLPETTEGTGGAHWVLSG